MKREFAWNLSSALLAALVLSVCSAKAQTIAYRQTNLTSNVPGASNNTAQNLLDPWGIAFLSGQPFFISDHKSGSATSHDAAGAPVIPFRFILPNPNGTALDSPTGIVADSNSSFGGTSLIKPFIVVTAEGRIFVCGPDAQGNLPQEATLVLNNASSGSVYKDAAALNSALTAPVLAVTFSMAGS